MIITCSPSIASVRLCRLCSSLGCIQMTRLVIQRYGGFPNWGYPQMIHFKRLYHYRPSIFGVLTVFRKHMAIQRPNPENTSSRGTYKSQLSVHPSERTQHALAGDTWRFQPPNHGIFQQRKCGCWTGWCLGHPFEKYESPLGLLVLLYMDDKD